MMKIFRYVLIALCLTLMSSHARSQTFTAYDLSTAAAGSSYIGNSNFTGTIGTEFDVNSQSIKITSLGVFDSGGDGFHNVLTAYLFTNTGALIASQSFSGTSESTAGSLVGYNRFIDVPGGIILTPGSYVIAAYGFSASDPSGAASLPGFVSDTFNSGTGLITEGATSLYAESYLGATFPTHAIGDGLFYNAATFQYSLFVPEPNSVALMCSLIAIGGSMAYRRARRHGAKKQA